MSALLLDHLWQSTLVLGAIALLAQLFRANGAHVRHALWMAASLKFLLPFAMLNLLGRQLATMLAAPLAPPPMVQALVEGVSVSLPAPDHLQWLLPVWVTGVAVVSTFWLSRWWKLHRILGGARDSDIAAPMPVKISPAPLEPGLVGIFRPVLLLPEGIVEKLAPGELRSIMAHEVCHLRRRDNLLAALHMLVEIIFWFWPPVWWLGSRLVAERECACDEAVLATGVAPQTYAQGILNVCKLYLHSPLPCAAGVSGADLNQRMESIMENKLVQALGSGKRTLLGILGAGALALPLGLGLLSAPVSLVPAMAQAGAVCHAGGKPVRLMAVPATHVIPPYPADAVAAHKEGRTILKVVIGQDGAAQDASVVQSSGSVALDNAARDTVRNYWRWQALTCRGTTATQIAVRWDLRPKDDGAKTGGPMQEGAHSVSQ